MVSYINKLYIRHGDQAVCRGVYWWNWSWMAAFHLKYTCSWQLRVWSRTKSERDSPMGDVLGSRVCAILSLKQHSEPDPPFTPLARVRTSSNRPTLCHDSSKFPLPCNRVSAPWTWGAGRELWLGQGGLCRARWRNNDIYPTGSWGPSYAWWPRPIKGGARVSHQRPWRINENKSLAGPGWTEVH